MTSDRAFEPFWAAVDAERDAEADAAVRAAVEAAEAAHPEVTVDRAALLRFLGERFDGGDVRDYLARIDPAELRLALACAGGDPRALRRFEADYFGEVRAGASRLRCSADELDEIAQHVRQSLFTGARLAAVTARGDLRALIRLMALRAGISLRRKQGRAALAGDALLDLPDTGDSPSLLVVKHEHRDKFRAALAAAVDALPPRDRALLKLHDLDGVGLAKLAVMHGVDRSTISRWLARARDAVYAETRRQLTARYGVDRADFDSFIDVIRSRFGASVHRMLES